VLLEPPSITRFSARHSFVNLHLCSSTPILLFDLLTTIIFNPRLNFSSICNCNIQSLVLSYILSLLNKHLATSTAAKFVQVSPLATNPISHLVYHAPHYTRSRPSKLQEDPPRTILIYQLTSHSSEVSSDLEPCNRPMQRQQ